MGPNLKSFHSTYAAILHDTIRCDEQFVKLLMKKVLLLKNTHFWKLKLFKCYNKKYNLTTYINNLNISFKRAS